MRAVANFLAVFTFVALWHDINLRLLMWGWMVVLFVLPEIIASLGGRGDGSTNSPAGLPSTTTSPGAAASFHHGESVPPSRLCTVISTRPSARGGDEMLNVLATRRPRTSAETSTCCPATCPGQSRFGARTSVRARGVSLLASTTRAFAWRNENVGASQETSERGHALTVAATWSPARWFQLTGELLRSDSRRAQRNAVYLSPHAVETQFQLNARFLY